MNDEWDTTRPDFIDKIREQEALYKANNFSRDEDDGRAYSGKTGSTCYVDFTGSTNINQYNQNIRI